MHSGKCWFIVSIKSLAWSQVGAAGYLLVCSIRWKRFWVCAECNFISSVAWWKSTESSFGQDYWKQLSFSHFLLSRGGKKKVKWHLLLSLHDKAKDNGKLLMKARKMTWIEEESRLDLALSHYNSIEGEAGETVRRENEWAQWKILWDLKSSILRRLG